MSNGSEYKLLHGYVDIWKKFQIKIVPRNDLKESFEPKSKKRYNFMCDPSLCLALLCSKLIQHLVNKRDNF